MTEQFPWHGASVYEIEVMGRLEGAWSDWFEGQIIQSKNSRTKIRVDVSDQAALHGILNRVNDLGLPLISVIRSIKE